MLDWTFAMFQQDSSDHVLLLGGGGGTVERRSYLIQEKNQQLQSCLPSLPVRLPSGCQTQAVSQGRFLEAKETRSDGSGGTLG